MGEGKGWVGVKREGMSGRERRRGWVTRRQEGMIRKKVGRERG